MCVRLLTGTDTRETIEALKGRDGASQPMAVLSSQHDLITTASWTCLILLPAFMMEVHEVICARLIGLGAANVENSMSCPDVITPLVLCDPTSLFIQGRCLSMGGCFHRRLSAALSCSAQSYLWCCTCSCHIFYPARNDLVFAASDKRNYTNSTGRSSST